MSKPDPPVPAASLEQRYQELQKRIGQYPVEDFANEALELLAAQRQKIERLDRVAALEAALAQLMKALKRYGSHTDKCATNAEYDPSPCDCGLTAALSAAPEGDTP